MGTPQSIFELKSVKECIPLSEPQSFFIKVWYIKGSKLYEHVFMMKRFKKILPSNLKKCIIY